MTLCWLSWDTSQADKAAVARRSKPVEAVVERENKMLACMEGRHYWALP